MRSNHGGVYVYRNWNRTRCVISHPVIHDHKWPLGLGAHGYQRKEPNERLLAGSEYLKAPAYRGTATSETCLAEGSSVGSYIARSVVG
jgi:hypothetical protein